MNHFNNKFQRRNGKFNHQIEQAQKRYGVNLTDFALEQIASRIGRRHDSCTCVFNKVPDTKGIVDGARQVWRVKYEGTDFLLVFRAKDHTGGNNEVITFLPSDQDFFPDGRQKGNKPGR